MTGLELIFTLSAAIGGGLFLVRMILQFFGGVADVHHDITQAGLDVSHTDISFKLLSFQGLTAFFMMFGLAGRALLLDNRVGPTVAVLGASAAGLFAVWVIMRIFQMMGRLQSSGTIDMSKALGQEGKVYLTIPAGGIGKVHLSIQNRLREVDGTAEDRQEIRTGEMVKVVRVSGNNILVVSKV